MASVNLLSDHRIYSVEEVAALVGLCTRQIWREIKAGRLASWQERRYVKAPGMTQTYIRRHQKVSGQALREWIEQRVVRAREYEASRRPGRRLTAL